jgi:glycosyltransferase involved in cell wall biosynthesis
VEEHAGSVASAGYVVLGELLRQGVHVDLYAHREHVPKPAGLEVPGFRYLGFRQAAWLDAVDRVGGLRGDALARLASRPRERHWRRTFGSAATAEHHRQPYDAVLTLGTTRVLAVPGVPNVTWLQAPFRTELEAIRRLRPQIVAVSGRPFYALAVAHYRFKSLAHRYRARPSEHLIVGSRWSREAMVAEGMPAERTHALPYPIDFHAFRPEPPIERDSDRPLLLSLGRLDPRKRLDLLFDAFALVLQVIPGARLRIVGRSGYAPHQLSLLDRFSRRDAVEYQPAIPRTEVPRLLRETSLLVQTSENENFGSSVAEALACGTAVVLGPTNGTADYIDANSRVFAEYEPRAVADAILAVLEAQNERPAEVRATTRAAAERWFAPEAVVDRLLEIIDEAISAPDRAILPRGPKRPFRLP